MRDWSGWIMTALSLIVGMAAFPPIAKGIEAVRDKLAVPEMLLWILAYVVLVAVLLSLSLLVSSVVDRIVRRVRQQELRLVLQNAETMLGQLEGTVREFRLEKVFDERAQKRLMKVASQADTVIRHAVDVVFIAGTQHYAPEVGVLLTSIGRHSQREIVEPFAQSGADSVESVRLMVDKATWGVSCVRLLIQHLQEAVRQHRFFAGRAY